MGLLGNSIEAKKGEQLGALMSKYHLDNIDSRYSEQIKYIASDLAEHNLFEWSKGISPDVCQMTLLSAIARQNFIIIQLLDEIAKK